MLNKNKKRKLLDGSEVGEYINPVDLIIHTKAPAKWKLIDLETGQEYLGSDIPHELFAEVLRKQVSVSNIGSWSKTKEKDKDNGNIWTN